MTKQEAFAHVIEILGSQAELARLLGVAPTTVSYWRKSGIPAEHVVRLDVATGGKIKGWISRPDIWENPDER